MSEVICPEARQLVGSRAVALLRARVEMVDYKLRLGDGTTFSVDEKGLTTWLQGGLVDDKARVQPAGSKKWFTLKQVLAAQGQQRGHALRQTEEGRADVDREAAEEAAEIERKVAGQRAAEERKAADDLASAERKAAEDRNAAERKVIEERAAAERRAAEAKAAAEARAAAERQAEQDRLEAERRAAEERVAAERRDAEAREAARLAEAERQVAAERAERAERKRKADEARLEAEKRAAEDARLAAERKAAEERAAALKAAEGRAAAALREAEAREAAAHEAERAAEAERRVAAERMERAERKRRAEEERLAEQRAADERLAAERRAAEERAASERAAGEREVAMDAFHVSDLTEPPATEIAIEPAATMVKVEDFERELGLQPVKFNDGTEPAGGRHSPAARAERPIQLKSLDRSEPLPEPPRREEAPRPAVKIPPAVDQAVGRLLKVVDGGVIWVVKTLAPRVGATIARWTRSLKTAGPKLTSAGPKLTTTIPNLRGAIPKLKSAIPKLKALLARRATPAEPASAGDMPSAASAVAPVPWAAPAPAAPRAPSPAPRVWEAPRVSEPARRSPEPARTPAVPPPSFQKLDVIPLAAGARAEPEAENEVWDGEDVWEEPGAMSAMFAVLWLWVKRVTIATALIVTAAVLYLNKEKWLPQSKEAAIVLGQQVDKLSEQMPRTVPPEAIDIARAQVPYLRADTIELIMAKSTQGVLVPAEVFRRAHQAADRARPSLPPLLVAEIDHHIAAVAAELDPAEGERLRAYLKALRAGTPTADYQDQEAVWLMARGVRRLPADRIARMQELFAQAVTAALQPPPA